MNASLADWLAALAAQGVELWFEGDRLRFRAPKDALSPEQRSALGARRSEILAHLRAEAAGRGKTLPLSFSQQSLWFLHQQAPGSAAYHIAMTARVLSTVDVAGLRHAVQALVDRHAILRTTYAFEDDAPCQRVAGVAAAAFDLRAVPGLSDAELREVVLEEHRRPFDLEAGPVLRASLFSRAPEDHVLLMTVHHIAADGWSLLMLFEELRKLYAEATGGPAPGLGKPGLEYTDYSAWQQEMLAGPEGERLWAYWQKKLAPPRAPLDLPTDRPRPPVQRLRGESFPFELSAGTTAALKELARQEGTTPFVVLLATFQALLFRLSDSEDVIVGTPTFARSKAEFMPIVGDFVNSVAVRGTLRPGDSFRALVQQLRRTMHEALDAQELPLPLLVRRLQPDRDPGRAPLFDTFFVLQRFDQFREIEALLAGGTSPTVIESGGLRLAPFPLPQQEGQSELALQMLEQGGVLRAVFNYSTDLYEVDTIRQLAADYQALVAAVNRDPDVALGALPTPARAARAAAIAYWKRELADAPPVLELPSDRSRPAVPSLRAGRLHRRFSPELQAAVAALAAKREVAPEVVLLAAWQLLLHRSSGQEDLVVGFAVAGGARFALRSRLAGDPRFTELCAATERTLAAARAHEALPLPLLVEALGLRPGAEHAPIFQVELALGPAEPVDPASDSTRLDLRLDVSEDGAAVYTYAADLFDESTIARLHGHLVELVAAAARDPGAKARSLPLLTAAEARVLADWNQTALEHDRGRCVHHLLEAAARATPDAVAVVADGARVTYRALDERANRLAHLLARRGVRPGALVAVCVDRSEDMPVAVAAVLKAGAAYVPLDPTHPAERLRYTLDDAAVACAITLARFAPLLADAGAPLMLLDEVGAELDALPATPPAAVVTPADRAYVIYTSGSTGRPKGVEVEHRNMVAFLEAMRREPGLAAGDVLLAVTTLSFDIAGLELWLPLMAGARIVIASRVDVIDGERLNGLLDEHQVTVMQATPATFRLMLDAGWRGKRDLKVLCGGEALPRDLADALIARVGELWNVYGPTETTVWSTVSRITDAAAPITIGRPIANTRIYVLEPSGLQAPIGVSGELCIGGEGVARGYHDRPDLTAEKFVVLTLGPGRGERAYRTGDVARLRADGMIDFLGRRDHQVKVRGYRIELGEIEAVLATHAGIKECAVVVREDTPGDQRLTGYVVTPGGARFDAEAARATLRAKLPEYMIPGGFVVLPALPLTPNGKIDRKALPAPSARAEIPAGGQSDDESLMTPAQGRVAAIWREVLGVGRVGLHDNFFDSGGHSLLVVKLHAALKREFARGLELVELFQWTTVAAQAARLPDAAATPAGASGAPERAPVVRVPRDRPLPVSLFQERLWLLGRLQPEDTSYNLAAAWPSAGPADAGRVAAGIGALIRRHEILRATFRDDGGVPAVHLLPPEAVPVEARDLGDSLSEQSEQSEQSEDELQRALWAAAEGASRIPFALATEAPARFVVFRLPGGRVAVMLSAHHIAVDAQSISLLGREIAALYGPPAAPLAPPELQYADYAAWQRSEDAHAMDGELAWWEQRLAGVPPVSTFPSDLPRGTETRGAARAFRLGRELSDGIKTMAREEGATVYMAAVAACAAVLHGHTGQDDLVLGSPMGIRDRPELETMIGPFVNLLMLRMDLSGDPTFAELLGRARDAVVGAFGHRNASFEKLVQRLQPVRSLQHSPFFQVAVVQHDATGAGTAPISAGGGATFDLTWYLREADGELEGALEYRADLYLPETVDKIGARLKGVLAAAVADRERRLSSISLLTSDEERLVVETWNATERATDRAPFAARFERQAAATPDAVAVTFEGAALTYAALDARANQVARHLRALGIGPGVVVGIHLARSLEMVVALLGIHKSGGAYLPLDPDFPSERLAFMLADSGARVLIASGPIPNGLTVPPEVKVVGLAAAAAGISAQEIESPGTLPGPADLAYIIYTSGSTGRPKGVRVLHGTLSNFLASMQEEPGLGPSDVLAAVTTLSFDIATLELYLPLMVGARVELLSKATASNGVALAEALGTSGATVLQATPATWRLLIEVGWRGGPGFRAFCGGEAMPRELADALVERTSELWNLYGPTETTVWSTIERVPAGTGPVLIGRPIANTQIYILNRAGQLTPPGISGEIWIGGDGVADGYHGRPELTAERFLPDRFRAKPGARLYRTGDLGRWTADGRLEHLGRIDHQVKLRGFRIELGEIEAVLATHAGIKQCVVIVREDAPGDQRLIGYVVAAEDAGFDAEAARATLRAKLPEYMIPGGFVVLPALPITPNGKIDRKALPAPARAKVRADDAAEAVMTPVQRRVAEIWRELLGVGPVGLDDNFFEVGGHSLLLVKLHAALEREFTHGLELVELFRLTTVAAQAAALSAPPAKPDGAPGAAMARVPRDRPLPISLFQERLWLLGRLQPEDTSYNIVAVWPSSEPADADRVAAGLGALVRRHEILRATFRDDGDVPAAHLVPAEAVPVEMRDLSGSQLEGEKLRRALWEAAQAASQIPFALATEPPARFVVFRLPAGRVAVLLCAHHIAVDASSISLLGREITALYGAPAGPLPPPELQYADYAGWQRAEDAQATDGDLAWWEQHLAGVPPVSTFPSDLPRGTDTRGATRALYFGRELSEGIKTMVREEGATVYMAAVAACAALLHAHTGQDDLVLGSPMGIRDRPELETMIGPFVNLLMLRMDLSGDPTFAELIGRARDAVVGAFGHRNASFEKLVERLQPVRSLQHSPIFQVAVVQHDNTGEGTAPIGGGGGAIFDLSWYLREADGELEGALEYRADLYLPETIDKLGARIKGVLAAAVADRGRRLSSISILTSDEERLLAESWNATEREIDRAPFAARFERQAAATPDAVAVTFEGTALTYAALDRQANQVARHLRALGIGPGVVVGIHLVRSLEMVVALLGIHKSGGAYLPLDPDFPSERLAFMLADSGARVLIASGPIPNGLTVPPEVKVVDLAAAAVEISAQEIASPGTLPGPADLAYIIYTSGSTGRPKGVRVLHGTLSNFLASMQEEPGLGPSDVLAAVTTLSFDIATLELYLPLQVGARVELLSKATASNGVALAEALATSGATVLQATPSTWRLLLEADWRGRPGFRAFCGGEAMPRELADALIVRTSELWNLYGPTETTVWSTIERVPAGAGPVLIGRPIANTQIYILNRAGQLTPPGIPGEIWIGGDGVADGYHGRPELTAERFLPDRFRAKPGARLYRTGDLGRWTRDGRLEHLGRIDHQVKVRGFRIELGEIEAVLASHPSVHQAVVLAREAGPGDMRLVAYLVYQAGEDLTVTEVRRHVRQQLPDYMVPSLVVALDALPLTPNGKIDRKALPDPLAGAQRSGATREAPAPGLEQALAAIWREILQVEGIGAEDNFFELGGHSLLSLRVATAVEKRLGWRMDPRALFFQNLRQVAAAAAGAVEKAAP
jgi:amino acid adenylation domain-containing protein